MYGLGGYRARTAARLALLAGVLGCGARAGSDMAPDPAPAPLYIPSFPPPSASAPARPEPAPAAAARQTPPPSPPQGSGSGDTGTETNLGDRAVDGVENILSSNCGSCHGPAAPVAGSAGIRFIDDVDQLVAAGLILPLNSVLSPIIRVSVQGGSMPPPSSGVPQISEPDLDFIVRYIDNPLYWPDVPVPTTPAPAQDGGTAPPGGDAGIGGG